MSKKSAFFSKLCYGDVDPSFYSENKDVINSGNSKIVYWGSVVLTVINSLFFIMQLIQGLTTSLKLHYAELYGISMVLSVIAFILTVTVLRSHRSLADLLYYYIYAIAFTEMLIVSTYFSPKDRMVTVFYVLMVLPVLHLEKPLYSYITVIVSALITYGADYAVKYADPSLMFDDICGLAGAVLVAIPFTTVMRNLNFSNIQARRFFMMKSEHDELTGLYNKEAGNDHVTAYLASGTEPCVLFMIDIDNFKDINDTYGHIQGDAVLRSFGDVMRKDFRSEDITSRAGGDEFMALMKGTDDPFIIKSKMKALSDDVHKIYSGNSEEILSCSIGAVIRTDGVPVSFDELFKAADEALYVSKNKGKNRGTVYEPEMKGTKDESKRGK